MLQQFSKRLKFIRKDNKLSQREFATSLGISDTTYQNYEYGKRVPPGDLLFNLIEKYNVNPRWLFTGQGEMLEKPGEIETETPPGFYKGQVLEFAQPGEFQYDKAFDEAMNMAEVQMLVGEIGKIPEEKRYEAVQQLRHMVKLWVEEKEK